jgi:hypothetical protein
MYYAPSAAPGNGEGDLVEPMTVKDLEAKTLNKCNSLHFRQVDTVADITFEATRYVEQPAQEQTAR